LHDFVTVRLGKSLEGGFADDVAKVDVVFAVLGFSKLVYEKLNRVRGRSYEA
jgi:hypothetical protein